MSERSLKLARAVVVVIGMLIGMAGMYFEGKRIAYDECTARMEWIKANMGEAE